MVMKIKRASTVLMVLAVMSIPMALAFMRTPALWPLMPDWLGQGLAKAFNIGSQEQAADVEFLSAWVLCFGLSAAG